MFNHPVRSVTRKLCLVDTHASVRDSSVVLALFLEDVTVLRRQRYQQTSRGSTSPFSNRLPSLPIPCGNAYIALSCLSIPNTL